MLGTGSRAACAAVRRHKFPRCGLIRRDSDARRAEEETERALSFARRLLSHGRGPMPQRTDQLTRATPCLGDKRNLSRASRPDSAARTDARPERASVNRLA